jgi:hypothetical protein
MKKTVSLLIICAFSTATFAQPRSIGLRLLFNQELTFQQYLGGEEKNFLQIDLGSFYFKGLQASVTYNWISEPNRNFSAYGGFGAGFGYSFKDNLWYPNFLNKKSPNYEKNLAKTYWFDRYFFVGITGHVGVEYQFDHIPLDIALDYRPLLGVDFTLSGDKFQYIKNEDGKPIPVEANVKYEFENSKKALKYHVPGLFDFALSVRYIF